MTHRINGLVTNHLGTRKLIFPLHTKRMRWIIVAGHFEQECHHVGKENQESLACITLHYRSLVCDPPFDYSRECKMSITRKTDNKLTCWKPGKRKHIPFRVEITHLFLYLDMELRLH